MRGRLEPGWDSALLQHLRTVDFRDAHLNAAHMERAVLIKANLAGAHLEGAYLEGADLTSADLTEAHLEAAHLEGADLTSAHLAGTQLRGAHLQGANLTGARLSTEDSPGYTGLMADLAGVFMNSGTSLANVQLANARGHTPNLADVRWGEVNLAVIQDWRSITKLGEELLAIASDRVKPRPAWDQRLDAWTTAVRANHQLSNALRANGLNEAAGRFAYRARVLQRRVWRCRGAWGRPLDDMGKRRRVARWLNDQGHPKLGSVIGWSAARWLREKGHPNIASVIEWPTDIFRRIARKAQTSVTRGASLLLAMVSGYGYKVWRSVMAYVVVIALFTGLYLRAWDSADGARWPGALVMSVLSFHGRGLGSGFSLDNSVTMLSAAEAVIGLIIEIVLIATLTQRLFRD